MPRKSGTSGSGRGRRKRSWQQEPRWRPTSPPVPFGKGPTEKDLNHGHLAGGLLHLTGGSWKRDITDHGHRSGIASRETAGT
jgi:hypothetical protein